MSQIMYELPNGKLIKFPSKGRTFMINGVPQPETYLLVWDDITLVNFGIKKKRDIPYDKEHYISVGINEVEVNGIWEMRHTLSLKMTVVQFAKKLGKKIKNEGVAMYKAAKVYHDDVTDPDGLIYDLTDDYIAAFETWRTNMRDIYINTFTPEVTAIVQGAGTTLEKYQALIDYEYSSRWPIPPEETE